MTRAEHSTASSAVARSSRRVEGEGGFSLLETLIATGIMLVVTASVFSMMNPAQGAFATEPEVADMQQRMRVGADTLTKDLVMAGAGAYLGTQVGSLDYFFAPVLPFRQGAVSDDAAGTFRNDVITLLYVPSTTAQTTLSAPLGPGATTFSVDPKTTNCPLDPGTGLPFNECGFTANQSVLIFDANGNYDMFALTGVNDTAATFTINRPGDSLTTTYPAGSKVVEAVSHTYYLGTDPADPTNQRLMHYDGTANADVPVVDHVVKLRFDYFGEAQPPILTKPLTDVIGPWTTYGPKPPALGVPSGAAYPAGENCTFQVDAGSGFQVPRLPVLGAGGSSLVPLTAADLTDGPWCPDAANLNRWDADLLRIRKVMVTLRIESATAALRGPASVLFTNGGTSIGGTKWVPDQEVRFQVSPRNLNLGR